MREKKFDNTNKKEKKVLFVSEFILEKPQGATQSAKAHYESLCELFEKKNIDVVAVDAGTQIKNDEFCCLSGIENRLEKLKNILDGNCTYVSKKIKEYIVQLIYSNNYCAVVFDNSYFGSIIKQIKQLEYIRNIPIIVYFHGVYHNASKQELKKLKFTKKIKYLPNHIALIHNEKLTVRYADKILLLNERDARELKKACKREADFRMPVYFNDSAKIEKKNRIDEIFNILFVGGKFTPNINGVVWFIKNVMPRLSENVNLYIIGKDMENVKEIKEISDKENIHLIGTVKSLDCWYNEADMVIGPIFEGDGMKTKTAEALMYGKLYIGTREAICGYPELKKYECNSAEEFKKEIETTYKSKLPQNKYYEEFRKIYNENYSAQAGRKIWKKIFEDCGINV